MARLAYHDMTDLSPELTTELAKRPQANIYRMLANAGDLATGYLKLGSALRFDGNLAPLVREVIILRTAALSEAAYELHHHVRIANELGIPADKVEAVIADGATAPGLDAREVAALRFTDEVVRDGKASAAAFDALAAYFAPEMLIEVTLLIGFYMMTSRFLQTFDVDLDAD